MPAKARISCAHAGEGFVAGGFRLGRQQGIQQAGLAAAETHVAVLRLSHPRQRPDALEPLLRQHAVSAVVQPHHVVAAPHGLQQRGQFRRRFAVLHIAVEFEPIHAARHSHAERARPPEDFAVGLDVPAGFHQGPHQPRQFGWGRFPRRRWCCCSPSIDTAAPALSSRLLAAASAGASRRTNRRAAESKNPRDFSSASTARPS